jgi:hypothetical protein
MQRAFVSRMILGVMLAGAATPPASQQPTNAGGRRQDGVGSDNQINNAARTFDPQDVVYVSIATDGATPAR